MYKVDDLVVYGKYGVCRINGIGKIAISDSDRLYYTLVPVYKNEEVIYAPVENGKIVMRHIISREEAKALIKRIPEIDNADEISERERENKYKETLATCDLNLLVKMIKNIYQRKCDRIKEGKKVTVADEKYFRLAEEQLYGELAYALDVEKSEVGNYVTDLWK